MLTGRVFQIVREAIIELPEEITGNDINGVCVIRIQHADKGMIDIQ